MSRVLTGPDVLARIGVLTDALTRNGLTPTEVCITPDQAHGVRVGVLIDPFPYRVIDEWKSAWADTASTVLGEVGCPSSGTGSPVLAGPEFIRRSVWGTPAEGGITYTLGLDPGRW